MADTAVQPALDAPDLPLTDYRAMREGREVAKVAIEEKPNSEAPPAADPPAAGEAGTATESETVDENVEERTSEDGQGQGDKPPAKRGLVDEVVKLRRENRELKTRIAPPPQVQQTPAPPVEAAKPAAAAADDLEPDVNKYSDYNKYLGDLVGWQTRQTLKQERAKESERVQREQVERAERSKVETWQGRLASAAEKPELANFQEVAFKPSLPVSKTMGDAIMVSEVGPEILYHLGSHPDVAARISKLDPISQIKEIGKLELTLSPEGASSTATVTDEEPPQKQAISKAPPPIPRPNGSPGKPNPARNLESISQAEYRALRESGKLR